MYSLKGFDQCSREVELLICGDQVRKVNLQKFEHSYQFMMPSKNDFDALEENTSYDGFKLEDDVIK